MQEPNGVPPTPRRKRGRPGKTSYSQIIAAAGEIVEEGGLEALTMRVIAEKLGVTAMSLYHYFPDRNALISATVLSVLEKRPIPELPEDPRKRVTVISNELVDVFCQLPLSLELLSNADEIFAPLLWTLDEFLKALGELGLDAKEAYRAYLSMFHWALGVGVLYRVHAGRDKGDGEGGPLPWYLDITQQDCVRMPTLASIIGDIPELSDTWSFEEQVDCLIDSVLGKRQNEKGEDPAN